MLAAWLNRLKSDRVTFTSRRHFSYHDRSFRRKCIQLQIDCASTRKARPRGARWVGGRLKLLRAAGAPSGKRFFRHRRLQPARQALRLGEVSNQKSLGAFVPGAA
jgi:hypothetical protein